MEAWRGLFPLAVMAKVFAVSRSGFHAWLRRPPSKRQQEEERRKIAIRAAHEKTRRTYRAKRIQQELLAEGFVIGRDLVARLRRELDIQCQQRRRFQTTTQSNHDYPVAPNLLAQQLMAQRPDTVCHSDITYIPTAEGWLYLAAVKDQCTCEIVGYAMGARMTQDLAIRALGKAIPHRRPDPGLIHYSDRGSPYCAKAYRAILQQQGLIASLSRKGNCYDNAPIESFWGSLKNEMVHHQHLETRSEAEAAIREYIEIIYNRQRRHSRIGYLAPAVFAQSFTRLAA